MNLYANEVRKALFFKFLEMKFSTKIQFDRNYEYTT